MQLVHRGDTGLSPSHLMQCHRGGWRGRGDLPGTLPASPLISKVAVIRSSCWGHRWEGVKSYARSYKQCVPINQIKAGGVYFQKVCFLHGAKRQRASWGRGKEREKKKGREKQVSGFAVAMQEVAWRDAEGLWAMVGAEGLGVPVGYGAPTPPAALPGLLLGVWSTAALGSP